MKSIEKIDITRKYTTEQALSIILDKVNELVDAHNHIESINTSICIGDNQISTLISDVSSINATVTTLAAKELNIDFLPKEKLNIDNDLIKNAKIDTLKKRGI
ncbi:hypothetical protein AALJ34_17085 [Paraclostridium bifermentans]|uniref:hypothetical protein n=1 Tax=Paraclostridium bifermentans TaxID=1490 RepID=UPI001C0FBED0|nr:hypothetical protein [Paraclostridium bifermentans]MBU5289984.1 hypothetical protein [Paraclostridium bifermentans]